MSLYIRLKSKLKSSKALLVKIKSKIASKIKEKESVLVIGDSHALVFESKEFNNHPKKHFDVVSVGGATVSGLTNPNSKTNSINIFTNALNKSKSSKVIFLLGEVDTGFVIWYRAERYSEDVSKMLNSAIDNYKKLIEIALERGFEVICLSTPLPTICDNNNWGEVANLRKSISATQLERTKLTIDFNNKMESVCKELKISYINFDSQSLGREGVVKESLLNKDPLDHHYDYVKYSKMILNNISKVI